ncbi:MAG: NAD(P)/FAD-dependent oxidoreductase [Acetobacteraceae bacterium]|nr:NAD(P)/FAD-dependent oxidoreductase [Acetobacteraceae bacterium]
MHADSLAALAAAIARDLDILGLPPRHWPAEVRAPDGAAALDVLVVGAGMCGIAAAAALMLKGVRNIAVLDAAAPGREGPWMTTARMATLRSPKHLPGIALGIPSLTFRAWFTARAGAAAWEALYKIGNADWQDYLSWLQHVLALPVRHGVTVQAVVPAGTLFQVATGEGVLHARHVVLATGREGAGGRLVPDLVDPALWPDRAAHAGEAIDFARLAGRRVAVLGANAAAFDNAAVALEAGAAAVDMYCRRAVLPQVNKSRGATNPGYFEGWSALPPAERWKLLVWLHDERSPPPHESVHRVLKHPGFRLHFSSAIAAARPSGGGVALDLPGGPARADFLIVATGFEVDLGRRPELAALVPHAALWRDAHPAPAGLERAELGRYPFLGPGFELTEKQPGACPALARVHVFNHAAHASMGPIASDIPGVSAAAGLLSTAIVRALFLADRDALQARLEAFAEPELESTPFFAPQVLPGRG